MIPYEIGVLLHYYARTDEHPDSVRLPPIWSMTLRGFGELNLLETIPTPVRSGDPVFRITSRGRAYVEALILVPLPEPAWLVQWPTQTRVL